MRPGRTAACRFPAHRRRGVACRGPAHGRSGPAARDGRRGGRGAARSAVQAPSLSGEGTGKEEKGRGSP
jgi:hypothetical protein